MPVKYLSDNRSDAYTACFIIEQLMAIKMKMLGTGICERCLK